MGTIAVRAPENNDAVERTKSPSLDKMSDRQLVNYVGKQITKFLLDMRPYLIEVHTRFLVRKAEGRPFLNYTDWDTFCLAYFNYTGRHVRRIISGEGLPKPRKKKLPASASGPSSESKDFPLKPADVWTDHDFIHECTESIKKILKPLESDPARYSKVSAAVADEITGGAA